MALGAFTNARPRKLLTSDDVRLPLKALPRSAVLARLAPNGAGMLLTGRPRTLRSPPPAVQERISMSWRNGFASAHFIILALASCRTRG